MDLSAKREAEEEMGLPDLSAVRPVFHKSQFVDNMNLKYWNTESEDIRP